VEENKPLREGTGEWESALLFANVLFLNFIITVGEKNWGNIFFYYSSFAQPSCISIMFIKFPSYINIASAKYAE
jgi:hypothetical protein